MGLNIMLALKKQLYRLRNFLAFLAFMAIVESDINRILFLFKIDSRFILMQN